MRPALQLKLSAQLALTPQLRQAIKLLAMNSLELETELSSIMENNPLLEFDDDFEAAPDRLDSLADMDRYELTIPAGSENFEAAEPVTGDAFDYGEATQELSKLDAGGDSDVSPDLAQTSDAGADLDVDMSELRDWGSGLGSGSDDEDEGPFDSRRKSEQSLREHLSWQLHLTRFNPRDRAIAEVLIDAVDDDGFLREPIEFTRAALAPELIVSDQEIEIVRKRLMHFDPVGALARDLKECLIVQLMTRNHPRRTLAVALVEQGLESIARADKDKLAKLHECESCELEVALQLIRELNPRPGSGFYVASDEYVIPDVEVRKRNGAWEVRLNPEAMPKVRVNGAYEAMMGRARREDANFLRTHLNDAKQILKSLAQREDTVLRVAQAIVKEQQGFFENGVEYMKPLVLRQIADMCELHESTVSRVTTRKYMHTPRGLFEFKHFFSSGVATRDGGEASATAISEMIRKLIESEESNKPLSDSALEQLLKARGVMVARRTVAKYREGLGIASSQDRVRL